MLTVVNRGLRGPSSSSSITSIGHNNVPGIHILEMLPLVASSSDWLASELAGSGTLPAANMGKGRVCNIYIRIG